MGTILTVWGVNEDADAGTEDIVEAGGTYAGQPALPAQAAEILKLVSGSANDAAAGTGARTVKVEGLNADGKWTEETFTLNGTTPVTSSSTWVRVIRAYIVTAGSGGTNAGAITINHNTTTANVFCVIKAGRGQAANAVFTVPANKSGRLIGWAAQAYGLNATAAGECVVELLARPTGANQGWRVLRQLVCPVVPTTKQWDSIAEKAGQGLKLSALTDLKVRIVSTTANTFVSADLNVSYE